MSRPYDNRPVGHARGTTGPIDLDSVRALVALAPHGRLARLVAAEDDVRPMA